MNYFIIKKWIYCIDSLELADAVGVNRRVYGKVTRENPYGHRVHFNGNFWWANTSYLKTLPELSVEGYGREVNRWDGEFWIGDGNPSMIQLWNSKVHHQTVAYYPSAYYGKEPRMTYFDRRQNG